MRLPIDVARDLAAAHRRDDPGTKIVKYLPSGSQGDIQLVEVTTRVPAVGEVLPFRFPADAVNGVEFSSTVILLSPPDWEMVQRGALSLPQGWNLALAQDV